jgi:hypothetical protein
VLVCVVEVVLQGLMLAARKGRAKVYVRRRRTRGDMKGGRLESVAKGERLVSVVNGAKAGAIIKDFLSTVTCG